MRSRYDIAIERRKDEFSFPACSFSDQVCKVKDACSRECFKKLDIKQQIIQEYIRTAAGRAQLAQSLIQPLILRRDYNSIARAAFAVQPLPMGALPIHDSDSTTHYSEMRVV